MVQEEDHKKYRVGELFQREGEEARTVRGRVRPTKHPGTRTELQERGNPLKTFSYS